MQVVVEEGWFGDVIVDPATGVGELIVDGAFIQEGFFISVGSSLTGAFVTA
jgi:hypothetical protein